MSTPEPSARTQRSRDFWEGRYAAAVTAASPLWSAGRTPGSRPSPPTSLRVGRPTSALVRAATPCGWPPGPGRAAEAIDFAPSGLTVGRDRARALGLDVTFTEADGTTWRADPPVDLVVMAYLQLPVDDTAAAVRSALLSLAPGGRLLLVAHDRDNLARGVSGPQDPEILTTEAELRAAVAGLDDPRAVEVVECHQVERRLDDGRAAIDVVLVAVRTQPQAVPDATVGTRSS